MTIQKLGCFTIVRYSWRTTDDSFDLDMCYLGAFLVINGYKDIFN
jgi:hypothetical protein